METDFIAALASAFAVARADFPLYIFQQNDIVDSNGGGFQTTQRQAFPGPPSCEDTNDYKILNINDNNDVSSGGYACDGCYY